MSSFHTLAEPSLHELLRRWEEFVNTLAQGWMSPGAYCSDVCCRDEIEQFLGRLPTEPTPRQSAFGEDLQRRLAQADAIFIEETELRSTCVIDAWQDRLLEKGEPTWAGWAKHQADPSRQWYFYRWMV
jgi:hypothetical protein